MTKIYNFKYIIAILYKKTFSDTRKPFWILQCLFCQFAGIYFAIAAAFGPAAGYVIGGFTLNLFTEISKRYSSAASFVYLYCCIVYRSLSFPCNYMLLIRGLEVLGNKTF